MGNDGGSIPKRRELVKSAARAPTTTELKATLLESLAHAWSHCPLTSQPLDLDNTVSDWRGRLYNYESILQSLMPSEDDKESPAAEDGKTNGLSFASTGIKGLKDVVKLKFSKRKGDGADKGKEVWACPVSMKELGSQTKAVYVVPCGHVFAEIAMKEIPEKSCPECSEKFEDSNVIPILPTDEAEIERLGKRVETLRDSGLTHSLKKDKSGSKKKRKAEGKDGLAGTNGDVKNGAAKQDKVDKSGIKSRINNPMTANLTAKVLAEQELNNKRRKLAEGQKISATVRG